MRDLSGQELGGYRLIEQVAAGGMAIIYKAYDPTLDRSVALKILPEYLRQDPEFAARFHAEARHVARLRHPNILPIYGYGDEQGLSYFVMELVEGGTLKDRMGHPVAPETTVGLVQQIAAALQYAHEQGIIHRDVKPSNVLLLRPDWAVLSDFGIARVLEGNPQLTHSGTAFLGTPHYMAPEQARGERASARSDQYALGIVCYELLTGSTPFHADTPQAIAYQHVYAELPPPRERNPAIAEGLEQVLLTALAKDPDERFPDVATFAAALRHAVEQPGGSVAVSGPLGGRTPVGQEPTATGSVLAPEDGHSGAPGHLEAHGPAHPIVPVVTPAAAPVRQGSRRRLPPWPWLLGAGAVALVLIVALVLALALHTGGSSASPVAVTLVGPGSSQLSPFRILDATGSVVRTITPTSARVHVSLVPGRYALTLSDAPAYAQPAVVTVDPVKRQLIRLDTVYGRLTVLPPAGRIAVPGFDLTDARTGHLLHGVDGPVAAEGIYILPGRYTLGFYPSAYVLPSRVTIRAHRQTTLDLAHTFGFLTVVQLAHAPRSGFDLVNVDTGKTLTGAGASLGEQGVFLPPGRYAVRFYNSDVYIDSVDVTIRAGDQAHIDLNQLFAGIRIPAVATDYSVSYSWREGSALKKVDARTSTLR